MLKLKINEIFYSIQCEGRNAGMPTIFIRLSGCNLSCDFCDTRHQHGRYMDTAMILGRLNRFKHCKNVVITGGEPTMQDCDSLANLLQKHRYYVAIETNGTGFLNTGCYDWITVSPKRGTQLITKTCSEVKVIYQGQSVKHWLDRIIADYYYLQPCSMKNIKATINAVKKSSRWRLSLQCQKLIDIR